MSLGGGAPSAYLALAEPGREGVDRDGVQLVQSTGLYWQRSFIKVQTSPLTVGGSLSRYMYPAQAGCFPPTTAMEVSTGLIRRELMLGLKVE